METIREKVAYLRGLVDAEESLKKGQVGVLFGKILEVVGDLATEVDELIDAQYELEEYLEEIDFDLAELEDEFLDQCEDDDCDFDDWDDLCDPLVEVDCPECHTIVTFDEDFLFDEGVQICCPHCDAVVFETDDFEENDLLFEDGYSDFQNDVADDDVDKE